MFKKPFSKEGDSQVDQERRKFLKNSGAAIASGLAVPILAGSNSVLAETESAAAGAAEEGAALESEILSNGSWHKPNIILLITDQERYPRDWPEGWADANLPNRRRLAKHGLTFTNACTAASACTPSRGTLFTGLYPPEHGAVETLNYGMNFSATLASQPSLQPTIPNMATMLAAAGYDVQYRGKWHLGKDPSGTQPCCSRRDLELYGFHGWDPPDSGTGAPWIWGGGCTDYDSMYAKDAADFLKSRKSAKPFLLVVSLVNPHDIPNFPGTGTADGIQYNAVTDSDIPPYKGTNNYGNVDLDASPLDQIELPATFAGEPYKPVCQAQDAAQVGKRFGALSTTTDQLHYVRFYAYLHMLVDKHMGTVLDALKSKPSLYKNTIIIRLADHGEMGLAHGGMRQKIHMAYEEIINTPFVISNPVLFPKAVRTSALASNVDIMPTLAHICGVPKGDIPTLRGVDLTPIIKNAVRHPDNPTRTVQDGVLFCYDDREVSSPIMSQPCSIRCLRQARWKISMYYDPNGKADPQYELYDLQNDPLEKNNLGNPSNPSYNAGQLEIMKQALQAKMQEVNCHPVSTT